MADPPGSTTCATPEAPDSTRLDAAAWLLCYLDDHGGSAPASDAKEAARAAGIAERTLQRARKRVATVTTSGFPRRSVWTIDRGTADGTTGRTGPDLRRPDGTTSALVEPTLEELTAAAVADSDKLLGRTEPRIFTQPLRPLTRTSTRGYEFIDFCERVGEPLLPWQKWLAIHALELNPDGTYRFRTVVVLVARQNGKSSFKRLLSIWRLYMDGARLVLGVAQDVSLAREQWSMCQETIHACEALEAEWDCVRRVNGDEWFRLRSGARYKIGASNRRAGRGLSLDELNIDELREQRNWDAWSALSKTGMARPNFQAWAMSNAGDDESVVLNQLRATGIAETDPSLGLFEWSAPDDCDLDDWDGIAQANPGLGYIISRQAIMSALGTDPPNVYRTEVLCQKVDQLDGAIDLAAWRDQKDARGNMDGLRDRLAACVDVAPDGQHVTLSVAALTDDSRVRVELVQAWDSTEAAREHLAEWLDKVKARQEGWYSSGPAAALADIMRKRRKAVELQGSTVTEACQELADLTLARRLIQPGDPLLDNHIAAAKKLASGDGWRFVRKGAGHVDAAYSVAGAVHLAVHMPKPVRPRLRWIS